MTRRLRNTAVVLCLALACPQPGLAHEGPPFPIIVDHRLGPYAVSVWTDPDIGIGTFYVILESVRGAPFPVPAGVQVAVRPVSGRLPEAVYDATRERVRRGARFLAEVGFDRGELWDVRIVIDGVKGELRARVEATPDGVIGPIGLIVYAVPFVLVGVLWWRAALARRRMSEEAAAPETSARRLRRARGQNPRPYEARS